MTITSALLNFREALFSLVPMMERVKIAWRRPDAYDEWDQIATTIFEKLVVEVIRDSLPEEMQEGFCLPSYDLLLPSYEDFSTLEVIHPSLPQGRWLFHAFGTVKEPFDVIEVRCLSKDGWPLSKELEVCSLNGATFCLKLNQRSELIEEIKIVDG